MGTIMTKTAVKKVTETTVEAEATGPDGKKKMEVMPYGLLVWATGNAVRPVVRDLMASIPAQKDSRRGLAVNEYLVVQGTKDIWATGDCAVAGYAPTAQVASQEGAFLARLFNTMAKSEAIETQIHDLSSNLATPQKSQSRSSRMRSSCAGSRISSRSITLIKDPWPILEVKEPWLM